MRMASGYMERYWEKSFPNKLSDSKYNSDHPVRGSHHCMSSAHTYLVQVIYPCSPLRLLVWCWWGGTATMSAAVWVISLFLFWIRCVKFVPIHPSLKTHFHQTNGIVTSLTAAFVLYTRSAGVAYFAAGAVSCSLTVKLIKRGIQQPRPPVLAGRKVKASYGYVWL